jgi:cobalamin biosynthetic protein CobC
MDVPEENLAAVDHGGSLGRARALFPRATEPFVDLSTGINPHSYPLFDLSATALTRLPEAGRLRELMAAAAAAYGAPDMTNVAAAPGTQILLPLVCSLVSPGRACVLGPTYAEHARAAAISGHEVTDVDTFEALEGADLAIVVNPNNPDGRIAPRRRLLDLAERLRKRGGILVVDEAFMDVGPRAESLAGDVGDRGIVVLRSFGKFFGLAGVRLGFALADPVTATRLEAQLGPWAVSGPALEYGIRALADIDWQEAMRRRLAADSDRLDTLLRQFGVPVTGGTPLFRLIDFAGAARLFSALGERGILLRHFTERPNVLRAGLPSCPEEWRRLESALADWARASHDPAREARP